MRYPISTAVLMLLTSCSALPQMFTAIEEMSTDEAVQAIVYKNAMLKDTDIKVSIDVINKDPVK